jgi:hypothetical protein
MVTLGERASPLAEFVLVDEGLEFELRDNLTALGNQARS